MTTYRWPDFELTYYRSDGRTITTYPDGHWSGCAVVDGDRHHAPKLGITPEQHRLAHEVAHHLVGRRVLGKDSSPVIDRDAHDEAQPEHDPAHEEWLVTALTYNAFAPGSREHHLDFAALEHIRKHADLARLRHLLLWLADAPDGAAIDVPEVG